MPHFLVTCYLWIADMAIKDYEVSACLRKGLSHPSTHVY